MHARASGAGKPGVAWAQQGGLIAAKPGEPVRAMGVGLVGGGIDIEAVLGLGIDGRPPQRCQPCSAQIEAARVRGALVE
ncbi:hypothetical protein D3C85_1358750 [compost metagenome]